MIKSKACSRNTSTNTADTPIFWHVSSKVISGLLFLVRPFSAYFGRVWVPRKKANIAVTLREPIRDDLLAACLPQAALFGSKLSKYTEYMKALKLQSVSPPQLAKKHLIQLDQGTRMIGNVIVGSRIYTFTRTKLPGGVKRSPLWHHKR